MDSLSPMELLWLLQQEEEGIPLPMPTLQQVINENEADEPEPEKAPKSPFDAIGRELVISANMAIAHNKVKGLIESRSAIQNEVDRLSVIDPDDREIALRIGQLEIQIEMCNAQIHAWKQKVDECQGEGAVCTLFDNDETVDLAKNIMMGMASQYKQETTAKAQKRKHDESGEKQDVHNELHENKGSQSPTI